jgi:diacylglycerol kinase
MAQITNLRQHVVVALPVILVTTVLPKSIFCAAVFCLVPILL